MQGYSLFIELTELPPGLNKVLRLNRWKRHELYSEIYSTCHKLILGKLPSQPLTKFNLEFTRLTIRPLDIDNLVASFKPFMDSLELAGVITNDGWESVNFDNTKYIQKKVGTKKEQKVSVKVEGRA